MTRAFRLPHLFAAAVASATLLWGAPAMADPTVTLVGPSKSAPGQPLRLDVAAAGFLDLYAYQFDVTFDPAAFVLASVNEGSFLSTAGSTFFDGGVIDNPTGTVTFVFDTLIGPGTGAAGGGTLAQLSFLARPGFTGSASFLVGNFVGLDSALNTLDVSVGGLTVAAVPEPSEWLLTLAGLGLIGAAFNRKARRTAAASPSV